MGHEATPAAAPQQTEADDKPAQPAGADVSSPPGPASEVQQPEATASQAEADSEQPVKEPVAQPDQQADALTPSTEPEATCKEASTSQPSAAASAGPAVPAPVSAPEASPSVASAPEAATSAPAAISSGDAAAKEAVRRLCQGVDESGQLADEVAEATGSLRLQPRGLINTGNICFMNSIMQVSFCLLGLSTL